MELKDNLKKLRKERNLTQQELANAIYVSRSAIAKWESGLGLPSEESMQALQTYFGIAPTEIVTQDPEVVIVRKNQKLKKACTIMVWLLFILLIIFSLLLPLLLQSGSWGPTPKMAAGVFADAPFIDTGDYRIYYNIFEGDLEDGRHWISLSGFKPVQRRFWGYTVSERDYESGIILHNFEMVGRLYSIKGENGYYNLIMSVNGNHVRTDMITLKEVKINGEIHQVENGFFFITQEPVEVFWLGKEFMHIE